MTYVITEPCIGTKEMSCVDVCPASCIHTTPEAPQNYIDPDVCIECEQCVLVCPVDAVFLDIEVPEQWQHYIQINADFFTENKPKQVFSAETAQHMLDAVQAYAERMGLAVSAVVLDRSGVAVASMNMPGADRAAASRADRKAYTSLIYRLGTNQLKADQQPPDDVEFVPARLLIEQGAIPLVELGEIVAAIGVHGSPEPEQDHLACQAGIGALGGGH
jgi:ferredoxin